MAKPMDADVGDAGAYAGPVQAVPNTANSLRTIPLCEPAVEALQMAWECSEKRKVKSSLVDIVPGGKRRGRIDHGPQICFQLNRK
jgi:hypothetical protein